MFRHGLPFCFSFSCLAFLALCSAGCDGELRATLSAGEDEQGGPGPEPEPGPAEGNATPVGQTGDTGPQSHDPDAAPDPAPDSDAAAPVRPAERDLGPDPAPESDAALPVDPRPDAVPAACEQSHVSRCSERQCGNDGFDGSCGTCPQGQRCDIDGQCVGCDPDCDGKACGDDGCGGSCGACAAEQTCSLWECIDGAAEDLDELIALHAMNLYRVSEEPRAASCVCRPAGDSFDWCLAPAEDPDDWCAGVSESSGIAHERCDTGRVQPSRLNADRSMTARLNAQHMVDYVQTTGNGFCGHDDPMDAAFGSIEERFGAYLGGVGLQNIWCGCVAAPDSPITGDPWHCHAMIIEGAMEFGLGQVRGDRACYQVQDPATDLAYLPMVINNEAISTASRDVEVYVWRSGFPGGLTEIREIVEVQLSENPCFTGVAWVPWRDGFDFRLSEGPGRKVVYARARDERGLTAVTWDSIYIGPDPEMYLGIDKAAHPQDYWTAYAAFVTELHALGVRAFDEGIRRIRQVRLPPLDPPEGYERFQFSLGWHLEGETMAPKWGHAEVVADPDASGQLAHRLYWDEWNGSVWTFPSDFPVMDAIAYFRLKTPSPPGDNAVASINVREDEGLETTRFITAGEFEAPNQYQWFSISFRRQHAGRWLFFNVDGLGGADTGVFLDRIELWSEPDAIEPGMTLDFANINHRGIEVAVRYVGATSDAFVEGPSINPYCSLCAD